MTLKEEVELLREKVQLLEKLRQLEEIPIPTTPQIIYVGHPSSSIAPQWYDWKITC